GTLDHTALEGSLSELVARHESLRTRFPSADGTPQQVILAPEPIHLPRTDLRGFPPEQALARALELARADAQRPFDLAEGPLLRAALLALADDDHILLLTMHHIISDGWSVGVLVGELAQVYRSIGQGHRPSLPPLTVQYADYALWQRDWLQGTVLERQLGYWRAQLAGLQPLALPTDFPRQSRASTAGAVFHFAIAAETADALRRLTRNEGTSMFMALLAVWQLLLARWSGQDDVAVGTPIAGRGQQATEDLIGCFVNTLVLRSDLARPNSFRELLAQVRETCLAAYAHQDIPFEQLVDALVPERDLSIHPLFQVMFALQNRQGRPIDWPGAAVEQVLIDYGSVKFDLSLSLADGEDQISAVLEYRSDLFAPETVARMAEHFCTLLAALVDQPDRPLQQHSLLTAEERAALAGWSESAPALPWRGSLPERLRAIAAQTPEATALRDAGGARSFAALLAQAQHLAAHLAARAPEPERPVAVLLERTGDLPAASLAVWLAGRTLLPL
ncbi:MAG TPA: condensation domain-containing protein, partial [Roseiflexaceae bacterium]|nr:condensation domain-containing protein [Roseiflexaceae bacterium]